MAAPLYGPGRERRDSEKERERERERERKRGGEEERERERERALFTGVSRRHRVSELGTIYIYICIQYIYIYIYNNSIPFSQACLDDFAYQNIELACNLLEVPALSLLLLLLLLLLLCFSLSPL
jgi:hypothetical protein